MKPDAPYAVARQATVSEQGSYQDMRGLKRLLLVLLGMGGLISLLTLLLALIDPSQFQPEDPDWEEMEISLPVMLLSSLQAGVGLVTTYVFIVWLHRAHRNLRALGAAELQFTPGWVLAWYFIPVFNFWKPYQAMHELWQASHQPGDWKKVPVPGLLSAWWGLWLLSWLIIFAIFATIIVTDDASTTSLDILNYANGLFLNLVAMKLVSGISQSQQDWAAGD
ncbi:MAG: hypothetical protein RL095_3120 [Verrucomicrobiota bacterium]|jgi:O-antigen/teichoic acid export membrane protein